MKVIQGITKAVAVALIASACFIQAASADNLYLPGTTPDRMFEVVKPVLGDLVTPIFLFGNDSAELMKSLNPEAVEQAGIEGVTFDYYVTKLKPESQAYGVLGYAIGGVGAPGNEAENRTCAIVMATRDQIKTTSTMFHEAVHCKNFSELRRDPAAWSLAVSMNTPALGMNNDQFMSLFHEVLAAYVQVAFSANHNLKDGLGMVMRAAQVDENTATSIGYRTARNALFLCSKKNACSTYSPDIIKMLAHDSEARSAMLQDIKELFDAASKSGYVVENADD